MKLCSALGKSYLCAMLVRSWLALLCCNHGWTKSWTKDFYKQSCMCLIEFPSVKLNTDFSVSQCLTLII